jgi:hypothetical protein
MGRGLALFSQIVRFLGLFGVPLQVGFQGKITFNHMLGQPILQKLSDFNGDIGDIVFFDFAIIDDKLLPPINFSDVFCRSQSFPGVSGQALTFFLFLFL